MDQQLCTSLKDGQQAQKKRKVVQPILHAAIPNINSIEADNAAQDLVAQDAMQDEVEPPAQLAKSNLLHNLPSIVDGIFITSDVNTNIMSIENHNNNDNDNEN
jgi:hypothetical protein